MPITDLASCASRQYSEKGEDFFATKFDGARGAFAIFDSHGGKRAGELCAAEMVDQLISLPETEASGRAFPEKQLVDTFWEMDRRLGREGIYSGTTASVLLVSSETTDKTLSCVVAWVGDSTALAVSMKDPCATSPPLWQTANHTPKNTEETRRCVTEWEVRREVQVLREEKRNEACEVNVVQLHVGDSLSSDWSDSFAMLKDNNPSFYASKRAPTPAEVEAAVEAAGLDVSDAEKELLVRALGREKRIEAPERRRSFTSGRESTRSNTKVLARGSANGYGPTVLAGGDHGKVSTCVTRSIGDWDGARAMIPQPELHRFGVANDDFVRVIIASDGVWDFVTPSEAGAFARRAKTADAAARTIADRAKARSLQKLNKLKDDTTCLVVDLNPSQLDVQPPAKGSSEGGAAGCCAVS